MRKSILIWMTTALVALQGCGGEQEKKTTVKVPLPIDSGAVRLAVMPTLDCLPFFLASEHGLFASVGLNIVLLPYQAQMDCDTALQRGSADGMATDLVRSECLISQGISLTYIMRTQASWQLLTGKAARISRLKQLDDKMLAMTRYSATDLLADLAVDSARLKPERVFRIQVNDVNVRLSMLQNAIMDALLLPEPQATAARNLHAAVLLDTRKLDVQLGVVAFKEHVFTDKQQQLFLKAYNQACDSINQQGLDAYSDIIQKYCGVTQQVVDSLPTNLIFQPAAQPREVDVERAKAWLKEKERIAYVEKRSI